MSAANLAILFAQEAYAPQRVSMLAWFFKSLGVVYTLAFLMTGFALFVGAVVVVILARRPSTIAAFLAFVPIPLLLGAWATVDGIIQSYTVIAMSTTMPHPSEVAQGYSTALVSMLAALLAVAPGYLVTAFGLFFRTMFHNPSPQK